MKLSYRTTLLVGLGFLSISAFWQMYEHVVPLILQDTFGLQEVHAGMIMAADNVLALFMLPLVGMLSDRTNTRLGRRMPYIIIGTIGAAITMMFMPIANSTGSIVLFMVGLGLTLFFMSCYRSPAVALMPDVTIKPLRSKGNAVINLMGATGGIMILGLTSLLLPSDASEPNYFPIFLSCVAIMTIAVVVLWRTVNEKKLAERMQQDTVKYGLQEEEEPQAQQSGKVPMDRAKLRSLLFLLASVVFWFMGYNAVTTWFSSYYLYVFDTGAGGSALVLMIAQAAAIVSYLPVGMIATRIGRKKCIIAGVIMLAVAFGWGSLFTYFSPLMYGVFILAGVAWATINVNSYPMVVEMAQSTTVGKFTGYYYTASMAAQILTPILSGWFLEIDYRLLFPYGAVFVALAIVTMLFVKHGDSKPMPKAGALESFEEMDG